MPERMNAVRLVTVGKPLVEQEIAVPHPGALEVLVRVKAAGIGHSDTHYRAGRSPVGGVPLTLGQEVAGEVDELGPVVTSLDVGDRVCLHQLVTSGK